jgi:hypothetical protein
MPTLPVPKYEPGRARYNADVTDDVMNLMPTIDGWGPLPSLKKFVPAFEVLATDDESGVIGGGGDVILVVGPGGAALSGEVAVPGTLGGIYVRLADGTQALFVGTQTALYRLNWADFTWEDVSGSSAPYNVGADRRWAFALFGSIVIAQNFNDPEQIFDVATDSVFADNPTAPRAAYVITVGEFVIRACLVGAEDRVQWSDLNDIAQNEAGLGFSDEQQIPEGAEITGLVPLSTGAGVFTRETYQELDSNLSSGFTFTRRIPNHYRGCIAPYSIRVVGEDDFIFYAKDGFFRGRMHTPIGAERFDGWFQDNVDYVNRVAMVSGVDFRRKIAWERVLMPDGSYRLFGYHYLLDRWLPSDNDMADMFDAETAGVTIDEMDNFFATIDDIDVPYDSSFWDGGAPELYGINSDGFLVAMNGQPAAWRLATNDLTFNGTGRSFVNGGKLISDAVNFTAQLSSANYRGASFTSKTPVAPTTRSRFLSLRGDGQVHRVLFQGAEGDDFSTITSLEIDAVPSGDS